MKAAILAFVLASVQGTSVRMVSPLESVLYGKLGRDVPIRGSQISGGKIGVRRVLPDGGHIAACLGLKVFLALNVPSLSLLPNLDPVCHAGGRTSGNGPD